MRSRTTVRIAQAGIEIRGIAACTYNDASAKIIHEFKAEAQTSLAKFMAQKICEAFATHKVFEFENISLVPMPSREASNHARGFNPAQVLANGIAVEFLRKQKIPISVSPVLQVSHQVADQASLGSAQRRENLVGAMSIKRGSSIRHLIGRQVILVDDIVTTGATLIEAKRALGQHGIEVAGFMTFAETLQRNIAKSATFDAFKAYVSFTGKVA